MKRHVIVLSGTVINTIEYADDITGTEPIGSGGLAVFSDVAQIGWGWDGVAFIAPSSPPPTKDEINAPIYSALDEIDRKSIRPIREGDVARMAALEAQALALRSQLVKS